MVLYRVTDPSTGREIQTSDEGTARAFATAQMNRWRSPVISTGRVGRKTGRAVTTHAYAAPNSGAVARNAAGQVTAATYPVAGVNNLVAQQDSDNGFYAIKRMNTPLAGPVPSSAASAPVSGLALSSIPSQISTPVNGFMAALSGNPLGAVPAMAKGYTDAIQKYGPAAAVVGLSSVGLGLLMGGGGRMAFNLSDPGGLFGGFLGKKGPQGDIIQGSSRGQLIVQDDVSGRLYLVKKQKRRRYAPRNGGGMFNKQLMQLMMLKLLK